MHYPRYRKAGMTIGSARIHSSRSSERLPAIRPHPAISLGGASHLHDLWPLKDVKPAISLGGAAHLHDLWPAGKLATAFASLGHCSAWTLLRVRGARCLLQLLLSHMDLPGAPRRSWSHLLLVPASCVRCPELVCHIVEKDENPARDPDAVGRDRRQSREILFTWFPADVPHRVCALPIPVIFSAFC
jgi:hypothetical protein